MPYDVIVSGSPAQQVTAFPAGANTVSEALDTNTGSEWVNAGQGWRPNNSAVFTNNVAATTAAQAAMLVFSVPTSGLYQLVVSAAQNTATGSTPGAATVSYTDADTSAVVTTTVFSAFTATTAQGMATTASTTINAKVGTTVTVATAIVGGAGGALNLKARASFIG